MERSFLGAKGVLGLWLAGTAAIVGLSGRVSADEGAGEILVEQLGPAPREIQPRFEMATAALAVSADGRRVAYVAADGSRQLVRFEGRDGPPHANVTGLYMLPDGSKVVYTAGEGDQRHLAVFDGQTCVISPPFVKDPLVVLSPSGDGRYLALGQFDFDTAAVMVDGEMNRYAGANVQGRTLQFSPDGKHWAYVLHVDPPGRHRGRQYHCVIDGKLGPPFEKMALGEGVISKRCMEFLSDGRVVFVTGDAARTDVQHYVTQDPDGRQEVGLRARRIGGFVISPDRRHFAYEAVPADEPAPRLPAGQSNPPVYGVVVDREIGRQRFGAVHCLTFSPDGTRLAFAGYEEGLARLYVDGEAGQAYQDCWGIRFSPDSRRVAFLVSHEGKGYVVVDGKDYGPIDRFYGQPQRPIPFAFSADSRHFAYADGRRVYKDGEPLPGEHQYVDGRQFRFLDDGRLIFVARDGFMVDGQKLAGAAYRKPLWAVSPDGKRLAVMLSNAQGGESDASPANSGLFIDGKETPGPDLQRFGSLSRPFFTPDSRHVLVLATTREHVRLILDGVASPPFPATRWRSDPYFLEPGKVTFYTIADDMVVRVTADIESLALAARSERRDETALGVHLVRKFPAEKEDSGQITGKLVRDADGRLYGVSARGGKYGSGTVFTIRPDGSEYRILHHFVGRRGEGGISDPAAIVLGSDGVLYGITSRRSTQSSLFRIQRDGSDFKVLARDLDPLQDICAVGADGTLYAIGGQRGPEPGSAILAIDPANGTSRKVLTPTAEEPGVFAFVDGGDGFFYAVSQGTLIRVKHDGSGRETLHTFRGAPDDLQAPTGYPAPALVIDAKGRLTGTTRDGVYQIDRDGGGYRIITTTENLLGNLPGTPAVGPDGRAYIALYREKGQPRASRFQLHVIGEDGRLGSVYDLESMPGPLVAVPAGLIGAGGMRRESGLIRIGVGEAQSAPLTIRTTPWNRAQPAIPPTEWTRGVRPQPLPPDNPPR